MPCFCPLSGLLPLTFLPDFCAGGEESQPSPDGSVAAILERKGLKPGDILFDAVTYYLSQCAAAAFNPLDILSNVAKLVNTAEDDVIGFASTVQDFGLGAFDSVFQTDFSTSLGDMDELETSFGEFLDDTTEVLQQLNCNTISKLYTETAYSSVCTVSITSIASAWGGT